MYYQSDYVLRMIEMMGAFLRQLFQQILHLTEQDKYDQAQSLLDDAIKRHAGIPRSLLLSLDESALPTVLSPARRIAAGDLLAIQAQLLAIQQDEAGAQDCLSKSMALLLSAADSDGRRCASLFPRVRPLEKAVARLSPDMLLRLADFYEMAGQYACAEDQWARLSALSPEQIPAQRAFYQRLLALSDQALENGRLPRSEVHEGLDSLP